MVYCKFVGLRVLSSSVPAMCFRRNAIPRPPFPPLWYKLEAWTTFFDAFDLVWGSPPSLESSLCSSTKMDGVKKEARIPRRDAIFVPWVLQLERNYTIFKDHSFHLNFSGIDWPSWPLYKSHGFSGAISLLLSQRN